MASSSKVAGWSIHASDRALDSTGAGQLSKKRTVLLLRTVVVISTGYLILFGPQASNPWALTYIAALLATNLALGAIPEPWFHDARFSALLLLGDTAAVLMGLYLTVGCFSQDFLIIYFFTIFLTTATQSIAQIAVGAAMISSLYGYWLWLTAGHALTTGEWLRLPFFFIVAVFYAYMTEETKVERWRRQEAERERERLRLLLNLAEPLASKMAGREWVTQVAGAVETACPNLLCTIAATPPLASEPSLAWFPIAGRDESFGGLVVASKDGGVLSAAEEQFCKVVALMVGHILGESKSADSGANARMRQEFLGMLSHELRTPLHAILGYTEMLSLVVSEGNEVRPFEVIERLRANAKRLQDLINEMLWLAEVRAGERTVELVQVDVGELLEEERRAVADQLEDGVVLDVQLATPGLQLQTDPRKLAQVVHSLVSNAIKFTERGVIRLGARCTRDGAIEITVSDNGIGIPKQHIETIFEDFRQLDASLTRRAGGIGLGLALARELVHLLGGRIEVESRLGCGSTFRVILPELPADAVSRAAQQSARLHASFAPA
jgi:signal transduction histidine kinase/uncharacterized membrane protein HdeD (DUF308 family)